MLQVLCEVNVFVHAFIGENRIGLLKSLTLTLFFDLWYNLKDGYFTKRDGDILEPKALVGSF